MKIFFNCFEIQIQIIPDNGVKLDWQQLTFWLKRFCPNVVAQVQETVHHRIYLITHTENTVCINNSNTILQGKWDEGTESALAKYITQVFQKELVKSNIFFVPAAAIAIKEKLVLIMGDFWQGKTTVALHAAKQIKGAQVLTDNYIAIKDDKVIGHTNYLSIRNDNKHITNEEVVLINRNNRRFIQNEYINTVHEICGLCIPHINQGDNNYHNISKEEAVWYLYQKMSRLHNGECVLFNGEKASPIFNNEITSNKILCIAKRWTEKYPIVYASGPLENISDVLEQLFEL